MLDPGLNPQRSWAKIREKGLKPGVTSLEQYTELVTDGMARAYKHLSEVQQLVPSIELLRTIHHLTFGAAHPWAGSFRRANQSNMIGGFPTADPLNIERELNLAALQFEDIYTDEEQHQLVAIALYHARFERIHPFKDGNGRIGRLIILSQLEQTFGLENVTEQNRKFYMHALDKSPSDIGILTHYLGKISGQEWTYRPLTPPFKIHPAFYDIGEEIPSIETQLEKSRFR